MIEIKGKKLVHFGFRGTVGEIGELFLYKVPDLKEAEEMAMRQIMLNERDEKGEKSSSLNRTGRIRECLGLLCGLKLCVF